MLGVYECWAGGGEGTIVLSVFVLELLEVPPDSGLMTWARWRLALGRENGIDKAGTRFKDGNVDEPPSDPLELEDDDPEYRVKAPGETSARFDEEELLLKLAEREGDPEVFVDFVADPVREGRTKDVEGAGGEAFRRSFLA